MPGTYVTCWPLKFSKNITKADYMKLCAELATALNTLYDYTRPADMIRVVPEAITEGGMQLRGGPGGMYEQHRLKTLRHAISVPPKYFGAQLRWPNIDGDDWATSSELLVPANCTATTTLKAVQGAPAWTAEELDAFKAVFQHYGIKVHGKNPKPALLNNYSG